MSSNTDNAGLTVLHWLQLIGKTGATEAMSDSVVICVSGS